MALDPKEWNEGELILSRVNIPPRLIRITNLTWWLHEGNSLRHASC